MYSRKINAWSKKRGYMVGIGGLDLLKKVKKELEKRKVTKEIDPNLFEEYLWFIKDLDASELDQSSSLIIVAVPRPAHIVSFELDTKNIKMILPPTYVGYRGLFETIRLELEIHVFGGKVKVKTLYAPLKTIASLLGVVSYGRNNITYIPEIGSYFQLVGFVADTPLLKTEFVENYRKKQLKECAKCRACINACPMGVISEDRFLIRAEKCYTVFSESLSPIPSEIHAPSPDCIIGCLRCQMICPVNKGRLKYEDTGVSFSSEETHAILDPERMNPKLAEAIAAKFSVLGLTESSDIVFRNFRNFMAGSEGNQ